MTDINLIDLLGESYFTRNDTLIATQAPRHNFGVAGEPVPYTIRGDNVMSIMLIACFVLFVVSLARLGKFFKRQFLLALALVDCLVLGMAAYLFATELVEGVFLIDQDYLVIALLFLVFAVYFLLKALAYTAVNLTFFGGNKNLQYLTSFLFLIAGEGVMMYPVVLLQVYFDLSIEKALYCCAFVLIVNKMLTFYRSWVIFFRQNKLFLQNFLYFCALEIVPLLALGGVLWTVIDLLKVNF